MIEIINTLRAIIKLDRMQFIVFFHLSLLSRLLSKNDISIDKFRIGYFPWKIRDFFYWRNNINHLSNSVGVWWWVGTNSLKYGWKKVFTVCVCMCVCECVCVCEREKERDWEEILTCGSNLGGQFFYYTCINKVTSTMVLM